MTRQTFLHADGRAVVVAIDHALYSWPCRGLESRGKLLSEVAAGGADGIIASYGTIRDFRPCFGAAKPILKLDLTTASIGGTYPLSEFVAAWTVEDALRLGVGSVLTYVQLGAPFELEALRLAGQVALACDRLDATFLCEIMPVECAMFPDPAAPEAIAAASRVGAELGGHVIKTTMPNPPAAVAEAVAAADGIPLILAGGGIADRKALLADVKTAIDNGAAGVAFGRNVWASADPRAMVESLCGIVHCHPHA